MRKRRKERIFKDKAHFENRKDSTAGLLLYGKGDPENEENDRFGLVVQTSRCAMRERILSAVLEWAVSEMSAKSEVGNSKTFEVSFYSELLHGSSVAEICYILLYSSLYNI